MRAVAHLRPRVEGIAESLQLCRQEASEQLHAATTQLQQRLDELEARQQFEAQQTAALGELQRRVAALEAGQQQLQEQQQQQQQHVSGSLKDVVALTEERMAARVAAEEQLHAALEEDRRALEARLAGERARQWDEQHRLRGELREEQARHLEARLEQHVEDTAAASAAAAAAGDAQRAGRSDSEGGGGNTEATEQRLDGLEFKVAQLQLVVDEAAAAKGDGNPSATDEQRRLAWQQEQQGRQVAALQRELHELRGEAAALSTGGGGRGLQTPGDGTGRSSGAEVSWINARQWVLPLGSLAAAC
jgi:hypothetical protein